MAITDIEVIQNYIRMCSDGWDQGWHERNGGNLTYRMKPEEVEQCRPYFKETPGPWVNMGVQADNLKGEYFISTGSSSGSTGGSWRRPGRRAIWRRCWSGPRPSGTPLPVCGGWCCGPIWV